MLVVIALILSLIPAAAVIYPFVRGVGRDEFADDESAPVADLMRRWDAAVASIRSTELENAIGNLDDADYRVVRRRLMTEAALVLKTMELEEAEKERLLANVRTEVREVRSRVEGVCAGDGEGTEGTSGTEETVE
ncbi:MAG: hypothetical protein QGG34_05970 [SAR202 cluster bacterium]|jgi:hypothetical protein|nr:hypothetical protein [SAR202 cluster bacterium]MDP7103739.1 hypothetical protein [SAR202 cluster bacterium]MDP7225999.1 hypothetical protein [SAR202 cluster bacterium]MDP7414806.1 hypothetical protein [SAR202 cluster bacterium]HJO82862.1 hypothetical protein [SAR202 cluster bacterium]|tara:strand:- start:5375 stop:5779 length:405 start_codon:yes stop_codon:yes gene_type:complete